MLTVSNAFPENTPTIIITNFQDHYKSTRDGCNENSVYAGC